MICSRVVAQASASLMCPQAGFRQVDVPLDPAQDFVADHVGVPQLDDGEPFDAEGLARQPLVFGGEKPQRRAGVFGLGPFQLADVIFVFDSWGALRGQNNIFSLAGRIWCLPFRRCDRAPCSSASSRSP